ncbi:hypothetical protein [Endozoicomonas sp.]|uniref:hypothetical protein n=1 Tax=Endozoicomonas sp. TaxID=1892382 RepID=UPI0028837FED|nr:hypothetical protein [Endozoicomonas sp.]
MEYIRKTPSLEAIILQHYLLISRMALATTLIVITILALFPINTIRVIELTFWNLPIAADKIAHLMGWPFWLFQVLWMPFSIKTLSI